MLNKKEIDFVNKIDCNFPYNDKKKAINLIDEAYVLSDYCLYSILYEFTNIPYGEEVNIQFLDYYVNYINEKLNHPFKEFVIPLCRKILHKHEINENEILDLMSKTKLFEGYYIILNIMLFAIEDKSGRISEKAYNIQKDWEDKKAQER